MMLRLVVVGLVALGAACGGAASPTAPSGPTRILALSGNLAFDQMVLGQTATATMTIANTGSAPLTIESITGSGALPTYAGLSWTGGIVPPGGTQAVTVTFRPMIAGTYTGALIVTGDQTSGTNTLAYSASVLPATPFSGTWVGTYTVTECQGSGSAQAATCAAASGTRPGGAFPVGATLPVSMALAQDGNGVTGTLALGAVTGPVAGVVDEKGLLTLRGTVVGGPFSAAIVHWSSRVIGTTMDGAAAYAVTMSGTPGVGGLVTSLVVNRQ